MSTHDTAAMTVAQPTIHAAYYPTLLHSTDTTTIDSTSKLIARHFNGLILLFFSLQHNLTVMEKQ